MSMIQKNCFSYLNSWNISVDKTEKKKIMPENQSLCHVDGGRDDWRNPGSLIMSLNIWMMNSQGLYSLSQKTVYLIMPTSVCIVTFSGKNKLFYTNHEKSLTNRKNKFYLYF